MDRDSQKEWQASVMKVYCIRLAAVLFSLVAGESKTKRAQNENFRQAHLSFTGDDSRIGLDFVSYWLCVCDVSSNIICIV